MPRSAPNAKHHPANVTRCKAPGTCGELVQGALDGNDFLVNCPIDLFSHASVYPSDEPGLRILDQEAYAKIAQAAELFAGTRDLDYAHLLEISSEIPRSKGMASSTADLSAAVAALARTFGVSLGADAMARLLTRVEPSDCVHFPGIAHVNHLTGAFVESMPAPCNLHVLIVDCGGAVDTLSFDRAHARRVYARFTEEVATALLLVKRGLRTGDETLVAEAATRSAALSQHILHKPQFTELLARTTEVGALGLNCAHSGTVLGVLHRRTDRLRDKLTATIEWAFRGDVRILGDFRIIGGGCADD